MQNPFRSEEAAFRLVWLTIGYFGLIAVAAAINRWAGLAVFLLETGALVMWWLMSRSAQETPVKQAPAAHPPGERRILVVANETVGGVALHDAVKELAHGSPTKVLVVCPALNSPLRYWVSDEDGARDAASQRLEDSLSAMRAAGIDATGEIGDADPLQAIEDAIRTFVPDELVISTHPEGRSNWLERGVVAAARERFDLPVRHVVVDLGDGRDMPASAAPAARQTADS